jgi:hypothetical protein
MQAGPEHGGSDPSSDVGGTANFHIHRHSRESAHIVIPATAPTFVIPAKAPTLVIPAKTSTLVIPAKAGIHWPLTVAKWIPAFAGMTSVVDHHHADPPQAHD